MRASNLRLWAPVVRTVAEQAPSSLLGCAAVFGAYLALAEVSQAFVLPPRNNSIFWLPTGMALALFLRTPQARWPAWLIAIFGAEVVTILWHGPSPLPVVVIWGAASTFPPLVGAWLLRPPTGRPFVFRHTGDVVRLFLLGAVVGTLPGSFIAAAANVVWLGGSPYWAKVVAWWSSEAFGVSLLCPFFLSWTAPARPRSGHTVEALALLLLLAGFGWWVFSGTRPRELDAALPFLLLPLTAWPALRFGARNATAATVILDLIAAWHTLHGRGPFAMLNGSNVTHILNLQSYIAFLNVFVLILAVVVVKEQQARAAAEQAEQRSVFLAAASELLSKSLDYEANLSALPQLCVRSLADWCVIDVIDGNRLRRMGGAHRDPSKQGLLHELAERYAPERCSPQPAAQVFRTGEPLLLPQVTDEVIRTYSVDEGNARLLRELGTRTAMAVPLAVRGQTIGVLTLASARPGLRYGPTELELVTELGRRAAIAIDNALLYRDAQDAIRLREEFLSVASHELNTPVHGLQLTIQSLKRGAAASTHTLAPSMERAERQVKKLVRLVGELLDVSRITAGFADMQLTQVDLLAVVHDVAERFTDELSRAHCTLTLQDGQSVLGRWDPSRLEQVVTNLFSNAIKFGQGRPIEVSVSKVGGMAQLVVRDHGIGIPPDRLPYIFDRFERAVSARSYGGLGLGLYIARSIVEALGGVIRAESTMGGGATFTVELPCEGRTQLAPKPESAD